MTKETERHVETRTMELKAKNRAICYPSLFESDFGGCGLNIASRVAADWKFDETRKREADFRDYKKKLENCEKRQKEREVENV